MAAIEGEAHGNPRLVLGLGNPGPSYHASRHNLGFRVLERIAERAHLALDRSACRSIVGQTQDLVLAMPQTYMNRSGYAARCLAQRYGIEPSDTLVVYDELDLPLGRLRIRGGGSPAGHKGMASVIEHLETDRIPRLRLGIRPDAGLAATEDVATFVLSPFDDDETDVAAALVDRAADACLVWRREGLEAAMRSFNG